MSEQDRVEPSAHDENKLIAERRGKLAELRARRNPFPNDFRRTAMAGHLQREYGASAKEELEQADKTYAVAGRLIRNRGAFLLIQDDSGQIQLYVDRKLINTLLTDSQLMPSLHSSIPAIHSSMRILTSICSHFTFLTRPLI